MLCVALKSFIYPSMHWFIVSDTIKEDVGILEANIFNRNYNLINFNKSQN